MRAYVEDAFTPRQLEDEITGAESHVIVAQRDGDIIGYARLCEHDDSGLRPGIELVRLYVDSAHHGAGVADALTDACLAEARARGHTSMWLGVWEHNPRAQRYYAKRGFVRVGEHDFMLGDDRQTDWIMERAL